MVFGFNNFNMMNMFPMNFGSFGFGSFGCGTGYSNFGSSLFGCGFGNNYLNPVNCDGSTNWGSVGFGFTAAFAPVLFAGVTRLVSGAVQNSNGNQQEVVTDDIETLKAQARDIQDQIDEKTESKRTIDTSIATKTTRLSKIPGKISTYQTTVDAYTREMENLIAAYSGYTEDQQTAKKADYNAAIAAKGAAEVAQGKIDELNREKEQLEKDLDTEKTGLRAQAKGLESEITKLNGDLEEKNKQLKKAQAKLEELRLDDYDGTAIQRTRKEDFVKRFNISNDKDFSYNDINNVTKSDVLYIINQYKTATPENKEKWGKLLKRLWNDNGLDPDIRNSSDCRGGYKLIRG